VFYCCSCEDPHVQDGYYCIDDDYAYHNKDAYCTLLNSRERSSPFYECLNGIGTREFISITHYYCIEQVCTALGLNGTEEAQDAACEVMRLVALECLRADYLVDWREEAGCCK
jgi:hypothetical protein